MPRIEGEIKRRAKTKLAAVARTTTPIILAGDLSIVAADEDDKGPRKFQVKAYNGGALQINRWDDPVVLDLDGLKFAKGITANLHHDVEKIVGHVTANENDGRRLSLDGLVSGTGAAAVEFLANYDNGYPWQASIESMPTKKPDFIGDGEKVSVNGQTFTGPIQIVRKSKLYGLAFVPRGADENTSVKVAASAADSEFKETDMEFATWIEAMGFDAEHPPTDKQRAALRVKYDAELLAAQRSPGAGSGDLRTTVDEDERTTEFDLSEINAAFSELMIDIECKLVAHQDDVPLKKFVAIKAIGLKACRALKKQAVTEKWAATRFEVEAIKASSHLELELVRAEMPEGPSIHGSPVDLKTDVIEAALCMTLKLPGHEKQYSEQVLDSAHKHYRNIGLQEALILAASANGMVIRAGTRVGQVNLRELLRYACPPIEAASTLSLPKILENVANKELLTGYLEEDQTWRAIAQVKSTTDFKKVTAYRLLDNLEYEQLGPNGEIKHGTVGEETYTRQVATYAKMFAITRENIINDDMQALADVRTRLGRGGMQRFNKLFWTNFLANSTFFTAARANYLTGATSNLGVDGVGLELGIQKFDELKSPAADGSKVISGEAEILLHPPALQFAAARLYQSMNVNTGGSSTAATVPNENIHAGKYRPVKSKFLGDTSITGNSATAWYLLRNPAILAAVCVSFLNGVEAPTVESADADFNTLGIQFRGYHDFGVDLAEYLCGIKSKGAA